MRTLAFTAFWVFFVDQAIKLFVLFQVFGLTWAQVRVPSDQLPYPDKVEVFPPFLVLRMAWNRGVNFGLGAGFDLRWWLVALAIVISVGAIWWLHRTGATKWGYMAGGLLVGGALGNVVDRVLYGAVADFLNMSCCGITNPYAFNVADISIFLGALGLAFLPEPKTTKTKRPRRGS